MKKLMGMIVILAVVTSPVMAEWIYTPVTTNENSIGIVNPADPSTINTLYITSGSGLPQSATFTVTFGFHLGPTIPSSALLNIWVMHYAFLYDNSSLEVIHAMPAGPFAGLSPGTLGVGPASPDDNFGSMVGIWPNPSTGITGLTTLQQGWWNLTAGGSFISPAGFLPVHSSSVIPFFRVQMHVKSAQFSQVNSFWVTNVSMATLQPGNTITPNQWTYYGGRVHEVPEPSSLALLGGGFALLGGGLVRRRRRSA